MDFRAAILWALSEVPSNLPRILWRYTLADLETLSRRRVEEKLVDTYQQRQILFEVVAAALDQGGEKASSAAAPQTVGELERALNQFG